jgi:hypothetical protein
VFRRILVYSDQSFFLNSQTAITATMMPSSHIQYCSRNPLGAGFSTAGAGAATGAGAGAGGAATGVSCFTTGVGAGVGSTGAALGAAALAFLGDFFFATTTGFAAGCATTASGAGAGAATGSEVTSGAGTCSGAVATGAGAGAGAEGSCLVAQADKASAEKSKTTERDDLRIPDMAFSTEAVGKKSIGRNPPTDVCSRQMPWWRSSNRPKTASVPLLKNASLGSWRQGYQV